MLLCIWSHVGPMILRRQASGMLSVGRVSQGLP